MTLHYFSNSLNVVSIVLTFFPFFYFLLFRQEVAHHVLFEQFGFPENTAANSRYIEMLCDALAAYFGAHPRGANLSQQDIEEFLDSAYLTGDCKFDDPSHHGTPKQRKAAAMFAIDLVQQIKAEGNTRREGHRIIPTAEFMYVCCKRVFIGIFIFYFLFEYYGLSCRNVSSFAYSNSNVFTWQC